MKLWSCRWSVARGWHWQYERDVNANNHRQWLAVYRKDEPSVRFIAQARIPRPDEAKPPVDKSVDNL